MKKQIGIFFVIISAVAIFMSLGMTGIFFTNSKEPVMAPGMVITASNLYGVITIRAGEKNTRNYSWDGGSKTVRLYARPSRWYGSLGIYHPGGGRDVHLVVDEGMLHFCSMQEAKEWLLLNENQKDWVCSSNGLVVGWYKTQKPQSDYWAVIVEVWQIYINGRLPVNFEYGENSRLSITGYEEIPEEFSPVNLTLSFPRKINGRVFSGWVQDRMIERKIAVQEVEHVIARGKRYTKNSIPHGWTFYSLHKSSSFLMVGLDENGRVIWINN